MAVAVFEYAAWLVRYPEFGAVSSDRAALFFAEASLYLDNTDSSPVQDVTVRLMLLNMVTAHIAQLAGALTPTGTPDGTVGVVTSATEGSTSVSLDTGLLPGSAEWWRQTQYGLSFWQATKQYRSARYVPAFPRVVDPWVRLARPVWRL